MMALKTFVFVLLLCFMLHVANCKSGRSGTSRSSLTKMFRTKYRPKRSNYRHYTPPYFQGQNSWSSSTGYSDNSGYSHLGPGSYYSEDNSWSDSTKNLDTSIIHSTISPYSMDMPMSILTYRKMLDDLKKKLKINQSTNTASTDFDYEAFRKRITAILKPLKQDGYSVPPRPEISWTSDMATLKKKTDDFLKFLRRTDHPTLPSSNIEDTTTTTSTVRTIYVNFNNLECNDDLEETSGTNTATPDFNTNVAKSSPDTEETTTVKSIDIDLYKDILDDTEEVFFDHTEYNRGIAATSTTSTTTPNPKTDVTKRGSNTAANTRNTLSQAVHIAVATNGGPVLNYAEDMFSQFAAKHLGIE